MRIKNDTLRDVLLDCARTIASTDGIDAISIRLIAKKASVATGTVYNYFSSKDEILLALTEEYWKNTFLELKNLATTDLFYNQLEQIFYFLKERISNSAKPLMQSLRKTESTGQERMSSMQKTLESVMLARMESDPCIRTDIWNNSFTKEQYTRFIMTNLMVLLSMEHPDILFFIEIIKRTLYPVI